MTRIILTIISVLVIAEAAIGFQNPLRDRLLRTDRAQEAVGWYQRADTGEFFLFDRSGTVALLKERDDPTSEVLVLFANRAPGGGTSFVTDTGREVIRITGIGGATYFPVDAPNGVIADYASSAGGLAPTPRSPSEVRERVERLAEEIADVVDNNVSVEYAPAPRSGLGVQYDAVEMIALAFADSRSERRRFRNLEAVRIITGEQSAAYRDGDALIVEIAADFGYAGRPSSALVSRALLGGSGDS
jgi:hypothetical protein